MAENRIEVLIPLVMDNGKIENVKAVVAGGAGATVGGAGGGTIGVLELAARGLATNLGAGLVVGAGAVVGALAGYSVYRLFRKAKAPERIRQPRYTPLA